MKKFISILSVVALVVAGYSCRKNTESGTGTVVSLNLPSVPYKYSQFTGDPRNDYKATLGRVLFYDSRLSVNNAISCASCHKQALGFADDKALSAGFEGRPTMRNSIAINSVGVTGPLFWDGREADILKLSMRPIANHVEMGISDFGVLPGKLVGLSYYNDLFTNAYGDNTISIDRIAECLGRFMSAITSSSSRFDEFRNGNTAALTAQEQNGMLLFDTKYNCGSCHNSGGGGYTGGGVSFKDIGLDRNYQDLGRGALTGIGTDKGTFKVPNLRNVGLTAPYMHDGRYKTLHDVLDHYSSNIQTSPNLDPQLTDQGTGIARTLNISENDKASIIAFLNSLTDYKSLTDPRFSNPFKVN